MKNCITFEFDIPESHSADPVQSAYDLFFNDMITAKNMRLIELSGETDARSQAEIRLVSDEIEILKTSKASAKMTIIQHNDDDARHAARFSLTAFPDFTLDIELPEGFRDVSFVNDQCPSFQHDELDLLLFVDYANPAEREYPETERFSLLRTEDGKLPVEHREHIVDTDDLALILQKIDEERATKENRPKV
jgi:hypothetical protein